MSDEHATLLVPVREEEVLSVESPVEECAVRGFVDDAQESDLTDTQQGCFGGSDEPVFGVVVDEDLLLSPTLSVSEV